MSNITYTQKIFAVDVLPEAEGLSNVIGRVKWEYRAHDGVHVAWTTHTTDLAIPESENFVSFDDVTEEIVLGWVNDVVDLTLLQAELDLQLQASISEFLEKDPPWETFGDNVLTREYVLVHQGEVVWGPMRWDTFGINRKLDELGLSVALPNVVPIIPETQPLVIGVDTQVYRVKRIGPFRSVLIDDVIYDISEQTWDFSTGIAINDIPYTEKSLEDIKQSVIQWLRNRRYIAYYKPQDPLSFEYVTQLTKMSIFSLGTDETFDWLDLETLTTSNISKSDLQTMIDGVITHQKSLDQIAKTRADSVRNAQSVQEVIDLYEQWKSEIE